MSFTIKPATRQGVIPLIDLYSESGCGKTMSALLLARGLVGSSGNIAMVDTETRRGSLYADVIQGGFNVLDLDAPFTPARYMEALDAIYASKASVVVVDSMSHEWEGVGGVNDMATENESRSGKPGLHNWRQPKMEHQKLVGHILRSPIPIICCIRAKYKTRQKKDERGKTIIVRDETTSPIQAEDFIFEATAHAEILQDHSIIVTKCSHPSLRECFPTREQGPITMAHGEQIAKWCAAAGMPAPTTESKKPVGQAVELQTKLWKLLSGIRTPGHKGWDEVNNWLAVNKIIGVSQSVTGMSAEQIEDVIGKAKVVLSEQQEAGLL